MQSADVKTDDITHRLFAALDQIDFGSFKTVVVALSGGSDSFATTIAAHEYLERNFSNIKFQAVTVDHQLRAESADEAAHVGEICRGLGIDHKIAVWQGVKPEAGIQEKAREARYHLLSDVAKERGNALVLTGHTKNDDDETKLMRRERKSGDADVFGISPCTLFESTTWFARPFLGVEKRALRDFLSERGVAWVEDPSNLDNRFERVRARSQLSENGKADLASADAADLKAQCQSAVSMLLDHDSVQVSPSDFSVHMDVNAADHKGFYLAMRVLLAKIGGTAHLPNLRDGEKILREFFETKPNGEKFTVNGCLLRKSNGFVDVAPESRNSLLGKFGYDHILPSRDFELAQAIRERFQLPALPPIPLKTAAR